MSDNLNYTTMGSLVRDATVWSILQNLNRKIQRQTQISRKKKCMKIKKEIIFKKRNSTSKTVISIRNLKTYHSIQQHKPTKNAKLPFQVYLVAQASSI